MFSVTMPAAYRLFLGTLHTPDPAMAGTQSRAGRLVRVERRLFTDWTGPTTPIIAAFERPVAGLLQAASIGRWHPSWGERPTDARERDRVVRRLAAGAPRLIPFAGQRYLVAAAGVDDGPILAVHGAHLSAVAPDLRSGLLLELGLGDPAGGAARSREGGLAGAPSGAAGPGPGIPFWGDLLGGIPWQPPGQPDPS